MDKNMKIAAIIVVAIVAIAGVCTAMVLNKDSGTTYKPDPIAVLLTLDP